MKSKPFREQNITVAGIFWVVSGIIILFLAAWMYRTPCVNCGTFAALQNYSSQTTHTVIFGVLAVIIGTGIILSRKMILKMALRMQK